MTCHFPFFPIGGPMRMIDAHPTESMISDLLGGAMPVPLIGPTGTVCGWVRETCSTEGLPRNPLAALTLHVLARGGTMPIVGPCAITMVEWSHAGPGAVLPVASGEPEGFPAEVAIGIDLMCGDMTLALAGAVDGFTSPTLDEAWAAHVRDAAEKISDAPLPDDYPFCGMGRPVPHDPVWGGVARVLGGGRTYVPFPTGG